MRYYYVLTFLNLKTFLLFALEDSVELITLAQKMRLDIVYLMGSKVIEKAENELGHDDLREIIENDLKKIIYIESLFALNGYRDNPLVKKAENNFSQYQKLEFEKKEKVAELIKAIQRLHALC